MALLKERGFLSENATNFFSEADSPICHVGVDVRALNIDVMYHSEKGKYADAFFPFFFSFHNFQTRK